MAEGQLSGDSASAQKMVQPAVPVAAGDGLEEEPHKDTDGDNDDDDDEEGEDGDDGVEDGVGGEAARAETDGEGNEPHQPDGCEEEEEEEAEDEEDEEEGDVGPEADDKGVDDVADALWGELHEQQQPQQPQQPQRRQQGQDFQPAGHFGSAPMGLWGNSLLGRDAQEVGHFNMHGWPFQMAAPFAPTLFGHGSPCWQPPTLPQHMFMGQACHALQPSATMAQGDCGVGQQPNVGKRMQTLGDIDALMEELRVRRQTLMQQQNQSHRLAAEAPAPGTPLTRPPAESAALSSPFPAGQPVPSTPAQQPTPPASLETPSSTTTASSSASPAIPPKAEAVAPVPVAAPDGADAVPGKDSGTTADGRLAVWPNSATHRNQWMTLTRLCCVRNLTVSFVLCRSLIAANSDGFCQDCDVRTVCGTWAGARAAARATFRRSWWTCLPRAAKPGWICLSALCGMEELKMQ